MIPHNLLWGVDVAIKRLRPRAQFQLQNTTFTNWQCPDNSQPPTWQEVLDQISKDKQAYEAWLQEQGS